MPHLKPMISVSLLTLSLGAGLFFVAAETFGFHGEVDPVLERRVLAFDQKHGIVRNDVAQRFDPDPVAFGEIAEHMHWDKFFDIRLVDADPHALVVISDVSGYRTQAVVASNSAAEFHPDFRGREIDLVVKNHNVAWLDLVEIRGFRHRTTRYIHICAKQKQEDAIIDDIAFNRHPLKTPSPWRQFMAARNCLHCHEPDVMAVAGVFGTGIAEADEKQ